MRTGRPVLGVVVGLAAGAVAWLSGCGGSGEKPRPRTVEVTPPRDVHPVLRETVQAEVTFLNVEPVLVSGYGLVVGLSGTGGEPNLPEPIAASMEREMALHGISAATMGKTPRQMLQDPNVAVVVVQAAIPPGAPRDASFDVYVTALNASSLEGGTLWTTDLRIGDAAPFGRAQEHMIGQARGPLFVNPFAEPGRESDGPTHKSGRVLGGGVVTRPVGIAMVLSSTSHARARSIVSAINSRFPIGPGDPGPTARGVSGTTVELRVPLRYKDNPGEFMQIVKYLRFDATAPQVAARRYVETLKAEPAMSGELGSALLALGEPSLPFVRELYDYAEPAPRLAALMVGAKLNDPRSAAYLRELARSGTGIERLEAINLLGQVEAGPTVDVALRELMGEPELSVRVAAYEALAGRAERYHRARWAALLRSEHGTPQKPDALLGWGESGLQGVQRRTISGKFLMDVVPAGNQLVYVTQQGRPRIVLFGKDQGLAAALTASVWNDRLLMRREPGEPDVSVQWRSPDGRVEHLKFRATAPDMVEFLARSNEPGTERPGLGLTYSQVVGVLDAVQQAGGLAGALATEENRLKADLLAAANAGEIKQRPETPGEREIVVVRRPAALAGGGTAEAAGGPRVVPITPAAGNEKPAK